MCPHQRIEVMNVSTWHVFLGCILFCRGAQGSKVSISWLGNSAAGLVADLWTLRGATSDVEEGAIAWIPLELPGPSPAPRKGAAIAGGGGFHLCIPIWDAPGAPL
jgi:hypothetical protein